MDIWPAESIWEQVSTLLPGFTIEVLPEIDSSNTELMRRARAGQTEPTLLVAERQTAGRGRLGRPWQSAVGDSLTFSLSLPYAPRDWSGLSLAVGVAVAQALDPANTWLRLKWPNDLWLADGRKLGGVLIETVPVGERRMCVVGVGLNVLPQSLDELATGYACLQERAPGVSAPSALATIAAPLVRALRRFEKDGFGAFAASFRHRDALAGRRVTTSIPGLPEGVAAGVDGRGALLVQAPDGELRSLVGGEVTVRPVADGGAAC